MIRFSLAALLLLVLLAGVGSAALVNANDLWRQTMVTLALTALLLATLAAAARRGRSRMFALGFAVSGWIYLVLAFVSALGLRDDLLTDRAVRLLFAMIHDEQALQRQAVQGIAFSPDGQLVLSGYDAKVKIWDLDVKSVQAVASNSSRTVDAQNFADIGHSLWVIVVGCLGGVVAGMLAGRENPRWAQDESP
jgi:hypothetical protein